MVKAQDWKSKGKMITINNHNIFVIDQGQSKHTLLILHGYPTSSFDYYKVLPELSKFYRVIIHDHIGFGFSDKPITYSYSLIDQATIALQLWEHLNITHATLLAHDYGTSIATEIIARANKCSINLTLEKLILCNGSIHIELSQLRLIQKLLKHSIIGPYVRYFTNAYIFNRNIKNVFFDANMVTDQELKAMWEQLIHNNGKSVIHKLSNYINERYTYWDRWIGALKETPIPTQIIWAENDPVAVPDIARLLATEITNNQLHWLPKTGHFPMIESPEAWIALVID